MSQLRIGLVVCGMVLAILGVVLIDGRLVALAIGMLLGSLIVRLIMRKRDSGNSPPEG